MHAEILDWSRVRVRGVSEVDGEAGHACTLELSVRPFQRVHIARGRIHSLAGQ